MAFSAIATLVACGGSSSGTPSNDNNSGTNNGSSSSETSTTGGSSSSTSSNNSSSSSNNNSSGSETSTTNSLPGIYTGKLKASTNTGEGTRAIGLITSEGDFLVTEQEESRSKFIGQLSSDKKTAAGKTYVNDNDTLTSLETTVSITTHENNTLAGTYAMTGRNGTFSLTANTELYNRGSSYAKLAGTWTNTGSNPTLVVQNDGSFSLNTGGNCQITNGQFNVFNSSKNVYKFTMTVSNCMNEYNGDYAGFAYISDASNKNDTLNLQSTNGKNVSSMNLNR